MALYPHSYLNLRTYCWEGIGWLNPTVKKERGGSQEDVCWSMFTIDKNDVAILIFITPCSAPSKTIVSRQHKHIQTKLATLSSCLSNSFPLCLHLWGKQAQSSIGLPKVRSLPRSLGIPGSCEKCRISGPSPLTKSESAVSQDPQVIICLKV